MIAEFVYFIAMAAICFSGLLFTLWTLGEQFSPCFSALYLIYWYTAGSRRETQTQWTFRSIAWMMVQVWFGNNFLSFTQASAFHPVIGPILMTLFAALSNTLLLTSEWDLVRS